jgi:hypothetical protein
MPKTPPVSARKFLRNFGVFKAAALQGAIIRIRDNRDEFVFRRAGPPRALIGIAKGKIIVKADLTQPTLPPVPASWWRRP